MPPVRPETSASGLADLARQLFARRRLIIASNRGPVEFHFGAAGELEARRGSGGVVTALSAVGRYARLTWVASAMTEADRQVARDGAPAGTRVPLLGEQAELRFVVVPRPVYQRYYNVLANPLIWFIQHYMWNTPYRPNVGREHYHAWEEGYVRVNRAFAEAIAGEAERETEPPVVMSHDYHLYLLPGLVRDRVPRALLQHFVHIPWPDPRYWQLLPRPMREEIFASLCRANIVGFQTAVDTHNFLYGCELVLPGAEVRYPERTVWYRGQLTRVAHYPISVDAVGLLQLAESAEVQSWEQRLAHYFRVPTVLRVDRAEPSKNVLRGLRAYEVLLEGHPELHRRVQMLALLVPSRGELAVYQNYRQEIEQAALEVNRRFGAGGWRPVVLIIGHNYARAVAAMRHYDVLMVNPVIDGMNLVSKEGPLVNTRDGVLVLSEAAGSHEQLGEWALSVAPADIEGTARALYRALAMSPEERRRRAMALRDKIRREDIVHWLQRQLEDLSELTG